MKKFMALAALLSMSAAAFGTGEIVSVDSLAIMQKSKEGQDLTGKLQKEVESFQGELKKAQKELNDAQESLNKQALALSKDALDQKNEELNAKRKKVERDFTDKQELLQASLQRQQMALRERQMQVIGSVFQEEGYAAMLDKNTPGLLCVANSIDKTESFLKAVDEKYQSAKVTVAKATPAQPIAKAKNETKTV